MNAARIIAAGLSCIALVVAGCSSGGGGGGNQRTVSGTAASGAPLASLTVTLKDASGASRTATTAANGSFSIDTTGLTPPFLVQVADAGGALYSVSADAAAQSTINVTPLTDLIIRSWYEVQGVPVESAFANPAADPAPSPEVVAVIADVVKSIVQLWMEQNGVAADSFSLISTPFAANGSGIDRVLDLTSVDTTTGLITVSDGSTLQQSTVSYSTSDGSMSVETTTQGDAGTSTSTSGTVVPVATAQQSALDAITALCDAFAATANSKGASLQGSDLAPYLDAGGVWGGMSASDWAGQVAYAIRGTTVSFSGVVIKSLDAAGTVADTVFQLRQSQGGQTSAMPVELSFTKVGGSWLISGDGRPAALEVRANMVTNQGSNNNTGLVLEVHVSAPQGAISGVTLTGGPWNAYPIPPASMEVAPWNNTLRFDTFETYDPNASISGGAPFTFVVTPTGGSPETHTLTVNAITTEAIAITNLTGGTLADAQLGSARTVSWTLPKTFAIASVRAGTVAFSQDGSLQTLKCDDMGEQVVLGTTSTSAQMTIPATCSGYATTSAEIYILVNGVNGEMSTVYYTYQ